MLINLIRNMSRNINELAPVVIRNSFPVNLNLIFAYLLALFKRYEQKINAKSDYNRTLTYR